MDQIDEILRLKACFKELEEIDENQIKTDIQKTKTLIAKKMLKIAQSLDKMKEIETELNVPKTSRHYRKARRVK